MNIKNRKRSRIASGAAALLVMLLLSKDIHAMMTPDTSEGAEQQEAWNNASMTLQEGLKWLFELDPDTRRRIDILLGTGSALLERGEVDRGMAMIREAALLGSPSARAILALPAEHDFTAYRQKVSKQFIELLSVAEDGSFDAIQLLAAHLLTEDWVSFTKGISSFVLQRYPSASRYVAYLAAYRMGGSSSAHPNPVMLRKEQELARFIMNLAPDIQVEILKHAESSIPEFGVELAEQLLAKSSQIGPQLSFAVRSVLGSIYMQSRKYGQAIAVLKDAPFHAEKLMKKRGGQAEIVCSALNVLGASLNQVGRAHEASDVLRKGLAYSERMVKENHENAFVLHVSLTNNLAAALLSDKKYPEAIFLLTRFLDEAKRKWRGIPRSEYSILYDTLALAYVDAGRADEGKRFLEQQAQSRDPFILVALARHYLSFDRDQGKAQAVLRKCTVDQFLSDTAVAQLAAGILYKAEMYNEALEVNRFLFHIGISHILGLEVFQSLLEWSIQRHTNEGNVEKARAEEALSEQVSRKIADLLMAVARTIHIPSGSSNRPQLMNSVRRLAIRLGKEGYFQALSDAEEVRKDGNKAQDKGKDRVGVSGPAPFIDLSLPPLRENMKKEVMQELVSRPAKPRKPESQLLNELPGMNLFDPSPSAPEPSDEDHRENDPNEETPEGIAEERIRDRESYATLRRMTARYLGVATREEAAGQISTRAVMQLLDELDGDLSKQGGKGAHSKMTLDGFVATIPRAGQAPEYLEKQLMRYFLREGIFPKEYFPILFERGDLDQWLKSTLKK